MSIEVPLDSLNDDQKGSIMVDLEIENRKKGMYQTQVTFIHPYTIHTDTVVLPYYYARNVLGISPPSRETFPVVHLQFTGELRSYQHPVRKTAIAHLNRYGTCLLALHVGWGKSIFAVYLATRLNFKTVIVLNKLMLVEQWIKEIETHTHSTCQYVKPKSSLDPRADFYIINATNVAKMGHAFFAGMGTCIIDEVHLIMAEKMFTSLQFIRPRYVIGLSATPYRPDGLNKLLDIYCGTERIEEKLNKHHDVYTIHTGFRIPYELQADGKINWNSVLNNQANHEERNRMIIDIIRMLPNRNFLILCKRVQHGRILVDLLRDQKEEVADLFGNTQTFDPNARILVATSQKCGVGFSHNKLDALIVASDMEEYFIQYLGRVFRNPDSTPLIFDLVDNFPVLQKHYQTRKRTYINAGGVIHEVNGLRKIQAMQLE